MFVGMRLPEVREISPLEKKFTRISSQSLDLMKVRERERERERERRERERAFQ